MPQSQLIGLTEGFFSRPLSIWPTSDRAQIINLLAQSDKINYYLYCPKQDPYVVSKWSYSLSAGYIRKLQKLLTICNSKNIQLAYGFNPELKLFSTESEYQRYFQILSCRITQLINLNIKNISVLYDDIPLLSQLEAKEKIINEQKVAQLLVRIANDLYAAFKAKIDNFIFCFYDYYFQEYSRLTQEINRNLNPKINIIWTGGDRFVKKVTYKKFKTTQTLLGSDKKIILWSNYPSNNCENNLGVFFLDPFIAPDSRVVNNLSGLLINPMREAGANLPVISSYLTYLNDSKNYTKYARPYQQFSYPNITSKGKFLYDYFTTNRYRESIIYYEKYLQDISSIENSYFLKTINSLLTEATNYISVSKFILDKKKVTQTKFSKSDLFPEYPYIARYLPEILRIVSARIQTVLGNKWLITFKQNPLFDQAGYYLNKYPGSQRLNISSSDEQQMIKLNLALIRYEQDLFYSQIISNKSLPAKTVLLKMAQRKNITRFTIKNC